MPAVSLVCILPALVCDQVEGEPASATFHGDFRGKAASIDAIRNFMKQYEILEEATVKMVSEGEWVVAERSGIYKARATGNTFPIKLTQWWQVRDGKVIYISEYFDTAKMIAALAL